jgi:hypothetical protein
LEESDTRRLTAESQTHLFKVRLVNSEERRTSASYLIERRYAWRGYAVGDQRPATPNRITVAAHDQDRTAATLTVGLDSPDGLFVDGLYREQVNELRQAGRRLAEFTKLAVESTLHSKALLAALFHTAFIYARRIHQCTDLLIEVNPRHDAFYRRMLGFERCGQLRSDPRVGAPALLLRLSLAHAHTQIARFGGNPQLGATTRSLYPYAFAPSEEVLIERRLRTLG